MGEAKNTERIVSVFFDAAANHLITGSDGGKRFFEGRETGAGSIRTGKQMVVFQIFHLAVCSRRHTDILFESTMEMAEVWKAHTVTDL